MSVHRVRAEELLVEAELSRTGSDIESSRQLQALVHASLAIAEQQLLANRIALASMMHADGSRIGYIGDMETAIFDYGGSEWSWPLKPEIREGLGL